MACLLAADTQDEIIRLLFVSLIDLVDDTDYKKYVIQNMSPTFYEPVVTNIRKEIQMIRSKMVKKYPKTPSVSKKIREIKRKWTTDQMTPRNPKIWGPTMWSLLHWVSLNYSKSNSRKIKKVVHLIIENLPCSICVSHATKYINENKIPINKGYQAVYEYFFIFHNAVNKQTQKKVFQKKNMLTKITQTCMQDIQNH